MISDSDRLLTVRPQTGMRSNAQLKPLKQKQAFQGQRQSDQGDNNKQEGRKKKTN